MSQVLKKEYIRRVYDVILYIEDHLDQDLSLALLARKAMYSPFHFHRIFKAITDETLNNYIQRKRLEKAAAVLWNEEDVSIAELADRYGFNSNASFTRAFKNYYKVSPTQFRESKPGPFSKIRKIHSKNGEMLVSFEAYLANIDHHKNWLKMNTKITVKEMPIMNLAFVGHIGPFHLIGEAYGKLKKWATPKNLLAKPNAKMLTIYHDNPDITEISKYRQSACLLLEQLEEAEGEVGMMTLAAQKYFTGTFEIGFEEFEKAWQSMFVQLGEEGYTKADRESFEIYHNDFNQHPEKKSIVEICIPVN